MAMSTRSYRQRSSTVHSSPPDPTQETQELELCLTNLSATLSDPSEGTYPKLSTVIEQAQAVQQHLVAAPPTSKAKNDFRHLGGFVILIDTLRAFSGFYHPTKRSQDDKEKLFALLEIVLATLAHVFREHHGNRRYFKRRVEGGGWAALEQTIASIGIGGSESDIWCEAQLFGRLLSFALDDKRLEAVCLEVNELPATKHSEKKSGGTRVRASSNTSSAEDIARRDGEILAWVDKKLQALLLEGALLSNPEVVPIIIDFWKMIPRNRSAPVNPTAILVVRTLAKIASISKHNLLALHSTRILTPLLPLALESDSVLGVSEKSSVEALCESLISLGINELNDAQYLLRNRSSTATDFLLRMIQRSESPAYIQFDLSLHGYSSIELPSLGRSFPPASSIQGYTFTAWIYVDQFDPNAHTTIFGAFDSTQTCFVLAYLEKDTQNFILQTSVTSSRPSVRFKSTVFQAHRWYHIAIVHRRPRTMQSGKATLFVDGESVEQVKCQYPAYPPSTPTSGTESFTSFTSPTLKTNPVQAFVGTPQELSGCLGRGVTFSRWSLASAHLFEDAINDDLIAVFYRLGPRYNGNFQDCLGSFQTYEASAALGMRNDLKPEKEKSEQSAITIAIKGKASTLIPESRILLSILPTAILGEEDRGRTNESQLRRGLNKVAASNLFTLTHNTGNSIAINAALPSINEALCRTHGTTMLGGEPVVVVPQSLDDSFWRLGGYSGIVLKLVENATTKEDILRAVEILFESINGSWRNSEAMERDNGYALLGALLRGKIGAGVVVASRKEAAGMTIDEREKLGFQLLSLILGFIGYNHEKPEETCITNPFAYRTLLLDFDMWRKTAPITQRLYYKQFITCGVQSKYRDFNARKYYRLVKRFLDALKAETFSHEIFPAFMEAFESLVRSNLTPDTLRSLSLFITYAYHQTSRGTPKGQSLALPLRPSTSSADSKIPHIMTTLDGKDVPSPNLTKKQMGNRLLQMYTGILCETGNTSNLKKFAKTVTNKWLLHLLTEDDPEPVVYSTKILARHVVVLGSGYATKFAGKTGGFEVMRYRLKRWWDIPALWPMLFCILFARDVADIDFEQPFELFSLLDAFTNCKVVHPAVLPVIISMLQKGLKDVLRHQDDPDSPLNERANGQDSIKSYGRLKSMSLAKELEYRKEHQPNDQRLGRQAAILFTVIRFLAEMFSRSQAFRDFAVTSEYIRLLLTVLFPVVVSTDAVSPETELNSKDSALTFEGDDVLIRPISRASTTPAPIVRTSSVETFLPPSPTTPRAKNLRRGSSFILLTSRPSEFSPSAARLNLVMSPKKKVVEQKISNSLVEGLLELVVNTFVDQVMVRKEFPGFGLFLKVPPGFQEHQAYFESYLLRNTIAHLQTVIQLDQKSLWEPKLIQNMARFVVHIGEAVFEGWFLSGAEPLLDFAGTILEYLSRPEISKIKSVRLCSQAIMSIQTVFLRVVLLRLSELDSPQFPEEEATLFMDKLLYWQTVVLTTNVGEEDFLKLLCYQLYLKLVDSRLKIRVAAANIWRILLVQKPEETSATLRETMSTEHRELNAGFQQLMEMDNDNFVAWIDDHRAELDALFFGAMSKDWEAFVSVENEKTEETAKNRVAKRREKLKQWDTEEKNEGDVLFRHEIAASQWMKNIYASEHLKHQRSQQDQQDNFTFLASTYSKIDRELHRPCAVFENVTIPKFKLDRTEGRNRMRLRMLPDRAALTYDYQPKRRTTDSRSDGSGKSTKRLSAPPLPSNTVTQANEMSLDGGPEKSDESSGIVQEGVVPDEEFELIDDPNDPGERDEAYEDKNRKVMRSLERGDQVQGVFNISRIIGLEAVEGLLIVGKESLYIIDNVFQRSDGEIVNVSQAPADERDPYLQVISGQITNPKRPQPVRAEQESRSWKWTDVISMSKRRFLFRDVAVELFFTDGRSYLLTAISPTLRDELHQRIASKAPHSSGNNSLPNPENAWRLEALKVAEEAPSSFSSKFGNIFNSSAWNPAMRRWAKGEISNFHYLMLVNTMAGRTFNDLTQYPVFPWILADYTSEELDLKNPATFRDLSKPMGAQRLSRQADFIERYKTFADMSDHSTPAFHYGTHYSSAMIVTSYLIRLQPFVQSYLLLQGGNFDHPDRLFYSVEKAWISASRDNMSDVRELIPEFFYLPEFLTNSNGYNFGIRQGDGGTIDNVNLPPWAKGDPNIFIAKHREALESPYVSKHLHQWIDLVFGSKQRGEAAVEAVNVFHHLSYHGAKDLDNIEDPVERLATIGIIHNFGQTPHQVFSKPHQGREEVRHKIKRLDTSAESLTVLPFPLLESQERVASLIYAPKLDRLLCTTAFRLNLPPNHDKYLEWGFADNSVRFFFSESKKLAGLFENMHQGQLSCALFASSQILITAGEDCVLSAHTIETAPGKSVGLVPRGFLFGHKAPVTALAVSKSFSTLLSASSDGTVILWDLNRFEFVRRLTSGRPVECVKINDVSGDIMLCRGQTVIIYTLNGNLLLDQNVCSDHDDWISACAFYEGTGNEWLERSLVFTGQRRGVVNVWEKIVDKHSGKWKLELVKRLNHGDKRRMAEDGGNVEAAITCVTPMPQCVYTGDEDGRVYEWDLVQRER